MVAKIRSSVKMAVVGNSGIVLFTEPFRSVWAMKLLPDGL